MKGRIPQPTVERLCRLYQLLGRIRRGKTAITSSEIGERLSIPPHTVRKDITFVEDVPSTAAGYDTEQLRKAIGCTFGFSERVKICIVGLGNLGAAILAYPNFSENGFDIAAGFDLSVNRMELLKTTIPLFPFYQMPDVVRARGITQAVLTVPAAAAQGAAEKLVAAGIRGILNFAPVILSADASVCVRNISVVEELRVLSASLSMSRRPCTTQVTAIRRLLRKE